MKDLSHDEAVRLVYELTPQIQEYDEFMYMGVRWMPYTMFFQHPNYVSDVINTDSLGFRISRQGERELRMDKLGHKPVSLVVGGSTVLGTGTTNDKHTFASNLSTIRDEDWLNFSCRGYNATQELLLFLMHRERFTKIDNVVVLSGINTLSLEGMPEEYASDHGRYYYSYEFEHYMERYNDDLKMRENTYASELGQKSDGLWKRFKGMLSAEEDECNPADKIIFDEDVSVSERVHRAAHAILKTLAEWQLLLAPFGAKLTFALQPMASWTKDALHPREAEVFHAIDSCPNNFWRMFSRILGPEVHVQLAQELADGCAKLGIDFIDMNAVIAASDLRSEYIFVDRVHFNDSGHHEVAKLLNQELKARAETG